MAGALKYERTEVEFTVGAERHRAELGTWKFGAASYGDVRSSEGVVVDAKCVLRCTSGRSSGRSGGQGHCSRRDRKHRCKPSKQGNTIVFLMTVFKWATTLGTMQVLLLRSSVDLPEQLLTGYELSGGL